MAGYSQIWSITLTNDEARIVEGYQGLRTLRVVLVVVDQPATIGALAVAVAQPLSSLVVYLPETSMRRIADMYAGTAKTDEKQAFIMADAARTSCKLSGACRAPTRTMPC